MSSSGFPVLSHFLSHIPKNLKTLEVVIVIPCTATAERIVACAGYMQLDEFKEGVAVLEISRGEGRLQSVHVEVVCEYEGIHDDARNQVELQVMETFKNCLTEV